MMLGLTIADAIAFGSLCAAFLAAFAGMVRGERVRKDASEPAQPGGRTGAGHREALAGLTAAVRELAAAIRAATSIDLAGDQYTGMIDAVRRCLDDRDQNKQR